MKNKKINFTDIKGMLSKDQMKQIKGGSIGDPVCGGYKPCTYYDGYGTAKTGFCGSYELVCACYSPTPGFMNFDSTCTHS